MVPRTNVAFPPCSCNSNSLGQVFIGVLLLGCPLQSMSHLLENFELLAWIGNMSLWPQVQIDRRSLDDCISRFYSSLLGMLLLLPLSLLHECWMLQKCCWRWCPIPGSDHWSTVWWTYHQVSFHWAQQACQLKSGEDILWNQWAMDNVINFLVSGVPTLAPPVAQTMGGILVNILTTVGTDVWQTEWAS